MVDALYFTFDLIDLLLYTMQILVVSTAPRPHLALPPAAAVVAGQS